MAWRLSTGMQMALLAGLIMPDGAAIIGNDISVSVGTGAGGMDKVMRSGGGLDVFGKQDFICLEDAAGSANNGKVVRVVQVVSPTELLVEAGVLADMAAGGMVSIKKIKGGGSVADVLRNGILVLYTGIRPASADDAETGTKLCEITLDAGAFVAGQSENGVNIGEFSGNTLKRAINPETGITEIWRGLGLANGTAGWARWYDNDYVTGASTSAVRMDGTVATSGGDVNMSNGTGIVVDVHAEVTNVSMTIGGGA